MKTLIVLALAATLGACAGAKPDFQLDIRHSKKGVLTHPCMQTKNLSHNGDVMNAYFVYVKAIEECGLKPEGLSVSRPM